MSTVFADIIRGKLPCAKVAENEEFLAFLSNGPFKWGHTIVIHRQLETDRFFDLPDMVISRMMHFSKGVALAIEQALPCERVAVMAIGLEVKRAHLHLIPVDNGVDITHAKILHCSNDSLEFYAKKIRESYAQLNGNTSL